MIETIEKKIDGLTFKIQQFPAMKGVRLEKRTMTILTPLLGLFDDFKGLDSEVDLSKLANVFQDILVNLEEEFFITYVRDMVEYTFILNEKGVPSQLNSDNTFNSTFSAKSLVLYKLLFEIMKVNKFAFFELLGGGGNLIGILQNMTGGKVKKEKKLEK